MRTHPPSDRWLSRVRLHDALRYVLMLTAAVVLPALWYIGVRAWPESRASLLHSIFLPDSARVFLWPALSIAAAWWLISPKPRVTLVNLLALPLMVVFGMCAGIVLGLAFTCEHMNKCM
jgi:hypothetical protein